MIKLIFTILMSVILISTHAQTDSIRTEMLQEVVVNADGQIETAQKTVLLPSLLEKKHASNGFDLLKVMQTADLEVSTRTHTVSTHSGGEVVLLVDGAEALPEDVAVLRSKNIRSIEYIRTPSGKYAGKAGVVNFVTIKMEYGGNVYLSANEGFAYKTGNYLAYSDFVKKGFSLSLTAAAGWTRDYSYTNGYDNFIFADNTIISRDYTTSSPLKKNNNQALRLRMGFKGENYRLNTYISLARQAMPSTESAADILYTGRYDGASTRKTLSHNQELAPSVYANYTLWLPKDQTIDFTASASFGHNKYSSLYAETGQTDISSVVSENNNSVRGDMRYYKSWNSGFMFSAALNHEHKYYKDIYYGTSAGNQRLMTDVTMGLIQLSGSTQKYYFYVSAGVSNSSVTLNDTRYNYCVPVAFYGGNYVLNQKNSVSINGLITHTLFDPSYKNDMTVPTSFFEVTKGNPNLAPLKTLSNTLSYNSQFGNSKISLSVGNNIYFDNILHQYDADDNTIVNMCVNDGKFIGNMVTATYAYSALSDKLRLSATAIEEYNMLRGERYNMERNILRIMASVTYLIGDWMVQVNYNSPYKALDIREPFLVNSRPVYELQVNWNHKNWAIEALLHNPFIRYDKQHVTMNYGCYQRDSWKYSEADGCNINLKVTYSFGFGKKQERGSTDIDAKLNSAIMRTH